MATFFYKYHDPCPYRQFRFARETHFFCTVPPRNHFPNYLFSVIRLGPYKKSTCPDRGIYKKKSPYIDVFTLFVGSFELDDIICIGDDLGDDEYLIIKERPTPRLEHSNTCFGKCDLFCFIILKLFITHCNLKNTLHFFPSPFETLFASPNFLYPFPSISLSLGNEVYPSPFPFPFLFASPFPFRLFSALGFSEGGKEEK